MGWFCLAFTEVWLGVDLIGFAIKFCVVLERLACPLVLRGK